MNIQGNFPTENGESWNRGLVGKTHASKTNA